MPSFFAEKTVQVLKMERRLLLITALEKEMKYIFQGLGLKPGLLQGQCREEKILGYRIFFLVTGIGGFNAALFAGRYLAKLDLHGVLNLGLAGSFDLDSVSILETVAVNEEIWPEFGMLEEGEIDPRGLGVPLGSLRGKKFYERVSLFPEQAAKDLGLYLSLEWKKVSSLTVSSVAGSEDIAAQRYKRYAAELENMEGFALAWACALAELPFLEIRTISNLVGVRGSKGWEFKGAMKALGEAAKGLFKAD